MASRLVQLLGTWQTDRAVAANLADRIRSLILDGRLTVGERLPSERQLATDLGRSRSTVTTAYDRLHEAGYVTRVHGGGTHVVLPHSSNTAVVPSEVVIDFTIASTGSTPGLYAATERALPRLAELRGSSGYTLEGLPDLRERIAARYAERGVPTDADEIIVTSGAMHALALTFEAFGRRGRLALVEQPTFPHAIDALRAGGHRIVPTPVTADGWDLGHLTTALHEQRPHIAYLVPDFHNPTGATMPDEQRARIVATARATGTLLVIDETCAELDIDRGWEPKPFAAFGDVISVGSMSKFAWGGLRIGWIRARRELVERILSSRSRIDLGTAVLEQCIAVELFDNVPALKAHVRERLTKGRAAVAEGLRMLPGVTMPETHGGLAVWVDLGEPISTALSLAAQDLGLRIPAGPRFAATPIFERFLRLPITLDSMTTADGMARLALAWTAVHAGEAQSAHSEALSVV